MAGNVRKSQALREASDVQRAASCGLMCAVPLALCLALISEHNIAAGAYPTRPLRLIVPYFPGGSPDLQGRLIVCEGDGRKVTRTGADGAIEILAGHYRGGRFSRPNDVICHSNGNIYFTDPDKRRPYHEREIPGRAGDNNLWDGAGVYCVKPDGAIHLTANCEYPNGLALSPDERTLYVANTRSSKYVHAIHLDAAGNATPALLKKLQALGVDIQNAAQALASLKRQSDGKAEAEKPSEHGGLSPGT